MHNMQYKYNTIQVILDLPRFSNQTVNIKYSQDAAADDPKVGNVSGAA